MVKTIKIALFIELCGLGIWFGFNQRRTLLTNHNVASGHITKVEYSSKSVDYLVNFYFDYKGKKTFSKSTISYTRFDDISFLDSLLRNKNLTVVYQKNDPSNSQMLFLEEDNERFKIPIPAKGYWLIAAIDSLVRASE